MIMKILCCFSILLVKCGGQVGTLFSIVGETPGFYVFGDSTVDCGTGSSDIYAPYGQDLDAAPRYTNGVTVTDVLELSFGLHLCWPYWVVDLEIEDAYTDIGFASAPAGILPATGSSNNMSLSLEKQIEMFNLTRKHYFPRYFPSEEEISKFVSKSIFAISIGSNDYLENYANGSQYFGTNKKYNRDEFSNLLISKLQKYLTGLYELGARTMVVFEIGPIGCYPVAAGIDKRNGRCVNELNDMISLYNGKLYFKLTELSSTLEGVHFILVKTFRFIYDMVEYPYKYKQDCYHGIAG